MRRVASAHRPLVPFAPLAGSLLAVSLLAGCPDRPVSRVDPTPAKEEFKDIPVEVNRDIDILFLVDNSGSMKEEQDSLSANFFRFIEVLENIEGGLPNVHIGVISTNVGVGPNRITGCEGTGDDGRLQSTARGACTPPNGAFISDVADENGNRTRNYTEGQLAETFSCIAELGVNGCGFEQHFESIYRALNGSNPGNQGFLRDDAFLAVIMISDEDDCSTEDNRMFDVATSEQLGPLTSFRCFEFGVQCNPDSPRALGTKQDCVPRTDSPYMYPVERYVDFLKGLKDDPNQIIVAGIIGNPSPVSVGTNPMTNAPELSPSCVSGSGEAAPGVRLKTFLDAFPQRNTFTTICNEDLSDALILVANLLAKVIGNPCLQGQMADTKPETPEIDPECVVADVRFPNTDLEEQKVIPQCKTLPPGTGELPCWHVETDPNCGTETNLALIIERGAANVPSGTHVQARCVTN